MSSAPILPGATLGVMGGGQLGRMFAQAAQQRGYAVVVLDPDPDSPAGQVSHQHIETDYADADGLAQLVRHCAAITTEFENVPATALATLAAQRPTAPGADAVEVCQDRVREKAHFLRCGVPCAPHAVVACAEDVATVDASLLPGILKTARLGYDGKGQITVRDQEALAAAWAALGQVPCVLEQRLPLAYEVSVIVARNAPGQCVHFPLQQNLHRDGVLAVTTVPAPDLTAEVQAQAVAWAESLAQGMGYVGVLCVEFFVLADGRVLANEMAPRPHNSGHYTLDACDSSQFDLQVRCMTGLPLVAPRLHSPAVMLNLLGDLWFQPEGRGATGESSPGEPRTPPWAEVLALPGVHLHLYGKAQARCGRKMGHLTVTAETPQAASTVARQVAQVLGLPWDAAA